MKTRAEVEGIARGLDGPKVVSLVDGTDAAQLTLSELEEMGFTVALYAVTALFAAIAGVKQAMSSLRETQRPASPPPANYADYAKVVDLTGHQAFSHDYEAD